MRILFLTDTHIRGTNPQNRTDVFYDSLQTKIREAFELAHEHDVDVILHGGDVFDRPDISPSLVREFALLLSEFPIPVYAVAGNHDLYGQNPSTIYRTMLGLLDGVGLLKVIGQGDRVFLQGKASGKTIQLTGQGYFYGLDHKEGIENYLIKKDPRADYAIHMVHGMLLEKPFFEGAPCTLIDNILETEADITLAGHYHSGFKTKEYEGKYFLNPGSIARISNSVTELSRKPKVYLIDLADEIQIKEIELKSAPPGPEVLDRSKLKALAFREKKLTQFIQSVNSTGTYNFIDITDIISKISEQENLPNEVVQETLQRIGVAQEQLTPDDFPR